LLECVLGFLTPLLMAGCSCDLGHARMAAIETLASYQARTQAELVKIAQIIGFGLIAMDNLRLSMADVSLSMRLRLRGGANALNRSAQQNNRALDKSRCGIPRQSGPAEPSPIPTHFDTMSDEDAIDDASVQTAIAQAETMVKAAQARIEASQHGPRRAPLQAASPDPATAIGPAPPLSQAPPSPSTRASANPQAAPASQPGLATQVAPITQKSPTASAEQTMPPVPVIQCGSANQSTPADPAATVNNGQRNKMMWARAMTDVARELTANLAKIPPARRKDEMLRATMLSQVAAKLATAFAPLRTPGSHKAELLRGSTMGSANHLEIPGVDLPLTADPTSPHADQLRKRG